MLTIIPYYTGPFPFSYYKGNPFNPVYNGYFSIKFLDGSYLVYEGLPEMTICEYIDDYLKGYTYG